MDRIQTLGNIIDAPEHQKSLTLIANDRASGVARSFTRDALTAWGLEDLLDRAVLIVSELTTNAERHGRSCRGTAEDRPEAGDEEDEQITLTLAVQAGVVGIAVEDNSSELPMPRISSLYATSGRGLCLVSATADVWTAYPKEDGSGKRVIAFVKRPEPTVTS
ncbi:hypothetical protein GCM10020367_06760 [Streptomyces sannanensis]|uniref:Histidine kinase/HSP90-like ATPase domain-containing protein n=1 Tax=Streptomyces sannanensis TaxID=285536 RepID=A0ABP6S520_9ACTN